MPATTIAQGVSNPLNIPGRLPGAAAGAGAGGEGQQQGKGVAARVREQTQYPALYRAWRDALRRGVAQGVLPVRNTTSISLTIPNQAAAKVSNTATDSGVVPTLAAVREVINASLLTNASGSAIARLTASGAARNVYVAPPGKRAVASGTTSAAVAARGTFPMGPAGASQQLGGGSIGGSANGSGSTGGGGSGSGSGGVFGVPTATAGATGGVSTRVAAQGAPTGTESGGLGSMAQAAGGARRRTLSGAAGHAAGHQAKMLVF